MGPGPGRLERGRRALGLRGEVAGGPQAVHREAATGEPSGPGRLSRGWAEVSVAQTQPDIASSVTVCGTHSRVGWSDAGQRV